MFFHIFTSEPTCLLGVINICRVARTSKSGLSRLVVAKAGCKSEKLEVTIFVSAAYVLKTSKPRLIPTPTKPGRLNSQLMSAKVRIQRTAPTVHKKSWLDGPNYIVYCI